MIKTVVLVIILPILMGLKMSNMQRFERNLGFLSIEEQERLNNSCISIAGVGGDGGLLAIQLSRLGVGKLKLADPEIFEIENINRQAACNRNTIGVNKAEAIGEVIRAINPDGDVSIYNDGISMENAEEFVKDSDLVIDETEYTRHEFAVILARNARKYNIPNLTVMNLGFGALVTTFHPDQQTLEKILGLDEDAPINEISDQKVSLSRWLPYIPPYADLNVFTKVDKGEMSAPSVSPGVTMAASIATTQSMLNILDGHNRRPRPIYAPRAKVVDGMTFKSKTVKFSRSSHYSHLSTVIFRNCLGLNPRTSY